jgi:hypothetical protein
VEQVNFTRHQNFKFEARNPKFETISNDQKTETSKQTRFGFRNWDLSLLGCFGPRDSFDIRISDFDSPLDTLP